MDQSHTEVHFGTQSAWSTVLPEKLTSPQAIKKSPAMYGIRRFVWAWGWQPQPIKIYILLRSFYSILIMKANEMHYFSNLFDKVLCMFRTGPLSIIRSISTLYTLSTLYLSADTNRTSMINTYCVYTVLRYSWWWTVELSETCRVLYEINLRNSATRWLSL